MHSHTLHILSRPERFKTEYKIVNQLMSIGNFIFHLRKPNALAMDIIEIMDAIDCIYHPRIIIHEHTFLRQYYDILGVHYSGKHKTNGENDKQYTSTSCHSVKELQRYDGKYNQMFISPIFESISK